MKHHSPRAQRLFALAVLVAVLGLLASASPSSAAGQGREKWDFSADRITAAHDSRYVEAWGNATLKKGEDFLSADYVRYYEATRWVYLKGNVRANWNGDEFEAEEAEFDLGNMVGWLKMGRVFMPGPHLYIESDMIRKYRGDTYFFRDAKVTACAGDSPAWSFEADEGQVDIDGYATLKRVTFDIKNQPVLYTPYMAIPAKVKRQSGLLMPDFGQSSRLGTFYTQPLFLVLDEEQDVTLYESYFSKRGFMTGLEYRFASDYASKGLWRGDYIYDAKAYNSFRDAPSQFNDDGMIRPNHARWWIRAKTDAYVLNPKWKFKLDLDLVSDQDYLREYKYGPQGYRHSQEEFIDEFGRDIAPDDSQNRTSAALVTREWDRVGLALGAFWTQNTEYMNNNLPGNRNPTVQRLPSFDFYAFKGPLLDTPLEWQLESEMDYLWREYGTKAGRWDVRPSLSLPWHTDYLTVIPTVGVRNTLYAVNQYQNESEEIRTGETTPDRVLPDVNVSVFSEMFKVFSMGEHKDLKPTVENAGNSAWTKIKHSIQPRVDYTWRPNVRGQSHLPYFDRADRLEAMNTVTYSITNVLDRRRDTVVAEQLANGTATAHLAPSYLDFFRLRLEQSYDFDEADRTEELEKYARRPFSDLLAELTISPLEYLDLVSRTMWSPYTGNFNEHEHLLRLHTPEWGEVYFGYAWEDSVKDFKRRRDTRIQQLRFGGEIFLLDWLKLSADLAFDLDNGRDLEKAFALTWLHECFTVSLLYEITSFDHRFSVWFELLSFDQY